MIFVFFNCFLEFPQKNFFLKLHVGLMTSHLRYFLFELWAGKEISESCKWLKTHFQQAQKHPRKISNMPNYILPSTSDEEEKYPFAYCPAGIYNTALRALQWKNALGWF